MFFFFLFLSSVLPGIHKACQPNNLSVEIPLMWEWGEFKSFDVATGPVQTMPSCHALNFAWGEH